MSKMMSPGKYFTNILAFLMIAGDLVFYSPAAGETKPFSMTTLGQVLVLNANQTIQLECIFYSEDLDLFRNFKDTVVWKKIQKNEEMEMNFMRNIIPPFLQTRRFSLTYSTIFPNYHVKVEIANLSHEDSGNYTCQVLDKRSSVLGSTTHFLFVRDNIHTIFTMGENSSDVESAERILNSSSSSSSSSAFTLSVQTGDTSLTFIEGRPSTLRCVSKGGYPPPQLFIRLSDKDITPLFHVIGSVSMFGEKGLRLMVHNTMRWTDKMLFGEQDDGKEVKCFATISGLISKSSSSVLINVLYRPIVNCSQSSAFINDRNVFLKCSIRSKPDVSTLYWTIDSQGTSLREGEVVSELWTIVTDLGKGHFEAQLFIRKATLSCFRDYELVTENVVGKTSRTVGLRRKENEALEEDWKRHQMQHSLSGHPAFYDFGPQYKHQSHRRHSQAPKLKFIQQLERNSNEQNTNGLSFHREITRRCLWTIWVCGFLWT